ncbi:outer membrane lipoprotein-sorting protein [Tenacibaculum sp. SZ-18]|uniref:outer membrane lipoprotein-sorting protein n=1 Tax=Tenacibaculum sp. SZ-18 TaxID=754423 RepID=UPI000C2D3D3C|nr:outer membrane lipoprotein-sorting protein [Tenacibaculum sp. SZ-18]AUC15944.1 outer membrane lipoprotein-sorting protein [Tenacibaculum sp. SZ-18]
MKNLKSLLIVFTLLFSLSAYAQTAEEIINNYIENIGGKEKLEQLKGVQMIGNMKMQGMEIPFEMLSTKDGKQLVSIELQGNKMVWSAFDGKTSWQRNQMTMDAEKSDNEATQNLKNELEQFPDPFLNYKEKGYTVELIGKETIDGTETFKIKLTKKPVLINGELTPNITNYYFDTENFVPIVTESQVNQGPMKGQTVKSTLSDYQEVDGLYFPFSIGSQFQTMEFKEIKLNPEVDAASFALPTKK